MSTPEMLAVVINGENDTHEARQPELLEGEVLPPGRKRSRITVAHAVSAYMQDARSRGLQSASLGKHILLFEKRFLPWTQAEGLHYLDEVDLDALLAFRATWNCCQLVMAKRQDTLIGFF
jgi:hypothetical protein